MADRPEDELHIELATRDAAMRLDRLTLLRRAAAGTVLLGGLPAASRAWASTSPTRARKIGGALVYAGWSGEDDPAAAKPFLKKHGVTLKSSYVAGNDD